MENVVLLHSSGMSSRQWRRLKDLLSPSYNVLAPDFLGLGNQPPWPEGQPFDFSMDVEAIDDLITQAGGKFHVVGHSYGGLVGLTWARQNPERVASVAVYDPVAFGVLHEACDSEGLADLARAEEYPGFSDAERGGKEEWWQAFIDYWNGPGSWPALPEAARQGFLAVGPKVFQEVNSLSKDRTGAREYACIKSPVTLIYGQRSPASVRRVQQLLAEALPDAHLVGVEAGHMGPMTHAETVNEIIQAHIARAKL